MTITAEQRVHLGATLRSAGHPSQSFIGALLGADSGRGL